MPRVLVSWVSDVVVRSKQPDRAAFVDTVIAETKRRAQTDDGTLALTVWTDLVRLRSHPPGTQDPPPARA